jgi:hypothetical protein
MIKQSESITKLAIALAKFQATCPTIEKKKDNPFFKSKYAALDDIIQAIRKPLSDAGLSYTQFPTDGSLTTVLMHESGEFIHGSMPIHAKKEKDPQAYGSAITYARRYSLASVLGLAVGDEDDDGNAANIPKGKVEHPKKGITDDQLTRALLKINVGEYTFEELEANFALTPAAGQRPVEPRQKWLR